jgi:multiple sugar transport system substrate-binding protein
MSSRRFWLLALLLVSALVLAACPAQPAAPAAPVAEAPAATPAPAAEQPAPVVEEGACAPATEGALAGVDPRGQTVVWWHQHSGSRERGLLELVERFNAENECGITVDAQNQGGYDAIRDKVNASLAAGELPATLLVGYQNDQAYYQLNDGLVDLDTYLDDSHWGMSAEEQADFYASFFDQSVHVLFDNQRLGFPPNRSMEVLYYNQTWLEELGFDGPPVTPEDFREMACAAAEANADGTGGYILRDDASALASWTYAFGGDVLNEDGTEYAYNGQATVEAMQLLKGMLDDGCAYFFTEGFPNSEFAFRRAIFTQGSSSGIPFYRNDVNTAATEQGRDPDVWGVTAIPHTTDDPVQNVYGGDVMIALTTPEQQLAAWIFVKWFTEPEIHAEWNKLSNYFPTRASAEEYLRDHVEDNAQYGQALALLSYAYYEPQMISYTTVRDAASAAFNQIMQGADIQSTLDELTRTANAAQAEQMAEIE